jgi:mannose-1-phosphate guanylyltransferase
VNDRPLLVNTLDRLRDLVQPDRTLILTNASLADAVAEAAPSIPRENIIAEPKPAGTAAALTWAALVIEKRSSAEPTMICVHADWAIADDEGFRTALSSAERVAREEQALVTVGVVPTRPDPGFGYIEPGEETDSGARRVIRFVEKPDRARAESMMHDGYLWNSGIFAWRVTDFLDEIRRLTPEVSSALEAQESRSLAEFFEAVVPISVDVGLLERSDRVRVLSGDFGWDDVGTWGALRRVKPGDSSGNVTSGEVLSLDAKGNVVHAEGGPVVVYGVNDLVVVTRNGMTLVTTTDHSSDLKRLIDSLPTHLRDLA